MEFLANPRARGPPLRRPRDGHAGTRAATAPRPRPHGARAAMNGSRARSIPAETATAAGPGARGSASESYRDTRPGASVGGGGRFRRGGGGGRDTLSSCCCCCDGDELCASTLTMRRHAGSAPNPCGRRACAVQLLWTGLRTRPFGPPECVCARWKQCSHVTTAEPLNGSC